MKYIKQKNKIVIKNSDNFNIVHILECGQVFRYKKFEDYYEVMSGSELARIFTYDDRVEIESTNTNHFLNYFDLDTDYSKIKRKLNKYEVLNEPIKYGYGIRILKQEPLETIISFILSSNNNIDRIQGLINGLSKKYGEKIEDDQFGDYYAFPTLEQLSKISEEEFTKLGAGYRAKYLYETIKTLQNVDINQIKHLSTEKAIEQLTSLNGVGPKVADCILLFGYYNMNVFPVDVWIEKVYNSFFTKKPLKDRNLITKKLTEQFKNLSGYAQQYLFYYKRDGEF